MGRGHCCCGVFDQHRVEPVETAIGEGGEDAAVEIDAGEKQGRYAEAP